MLAEIFMIRLESALAATAEPTPAVARFVPFDKASFAGFKAGRARAKRSVR